MKYRISGQVTISVFTDVEAESLDEAIEEAEQRGLMGFCHQCAGGRTKKEEWVTSGELDGEVEIKKDDSCEL